MLRISASVGQDGTNKSADVGVAQEALRAAGMNPGPIDKICGRKTIAAIYGFQQKFLTRPDGRIDPGGRTAARLQPGRPSATQTPQVRPATPAASPEAVRTNWTGDSSQWAQSKKLASLEPGFRAKIERVIEVLRGQNFQPHIVFGWRSVAVQQQLVRQGRSKVRFSFHNAQTPQGIPNAWAVDLIDKRWAWNEPDCHTFFRALGVAGKAEGLVWGGDWVSFRDWAHLQGRANSELGAVKRESGL